MNVENSHFWCYAFLGFCDDSLSSLPWQSNRVQSAVCVYCAVTLRDRDVTMEVVARDAQNTHTQNNIKITYHKYMFIHT